MQPSHPPSPFSPIAFTFPSIRVFSNESDLPIRWPKYWSFSFSFSPSSEYSGLIYLRLIGFISLLAKGPSRVFSSTKYGEQPFFMVQLSHLYMTTGKTTALTIWTFVNKVMFLLFNTLSNIVITFLPRSKCLWISWLQSPSTVTLEPKKRKFVTASTFPPLP